MPIIVYTTTTCPNCVKAKEFLTSKGITFETKDVSSDKATAMFLLKKTRKMSVPVIQINDKFIVGYDEQQIEKVLEEENIY